MKPLLATMLALAVLTLAACDDDEESPAVPAQTTQGTTGVTGPNDPPIVVRERTNWADRSLQRSYDDARFDCLSKKLRTLARTLDVRPDPERVARAVSRGYPEVFQLPTYVGCRRGLIQSGEASERDFQ